MPTNISVATIDSSDTLTDNINITAHVIIEKNLAVNGANALMYNLNVDGSLATDTILGRASDEVTIADNLKVTGNTVLDGNLDIGFNLTCGDIIANGIYGTAAIQIQSNINTAISNYNPFWAAGRVNGTNLSILKSNGKYGFTVTRPSGFPNGVYGISFNTPAPDANYIINLTQIASGNIKVWDHPTLVVSTSSFYIVTYNTSWQATIFDFWFSVFV